ncbi:MAG TPA: hypothetical protein VGG45_16515 [Terracidiphilus sp.]|jgi:hypothetical protein
MSSSGGGSGGMHPKVVILHPLANVAPPQADVSDIQDWCDSLDDSNPLKAALEAYLAAIPSD